MSRSTACHTVAVFPMDRPTLEETIALLEATLEATHDGILVLDLNHRVIRYNRVLAEMLRLPPEAIDTENADELLGGVIDQLEDPEEFQRRSKELWSDPAARSSDILRFRDGRVYERFVAPHRIGSTIVGRVISIRDIGPAVRTAQALEQHRAFLEKAQEIGHIGSWVAELDGSDRLGWSTESHRIFGVALGKFEGSSAAFFEFVHPDDRAAVHAASDKAVADGQPYDFEHRVVRPDGIVRWVHEKARRGGRCAWSAPCRTSPSGASSRISCGNHRRWRRSAGWRAASRTT